MSRFGPLTLIFLGLLAFVNAIRHPFVHDDVFYILNDPHIADLRHWYEAFKNPLAAVDINTYYRPVLEIIYRLEYHFYGTNPSGFHLFNCLVHVINGLLLFSLLQKLGLREAAAWLIACIFLIHPVQTEAVACISGISNLWMAMGVLLALHAYLNKWHLATILFFTAAFLSKEQAVMFVPLLMVIDYSRGQKNFGKWFLWGLVTVVLLWLRQSVTGASLFKDILNSPGELYLRLAAIPRVIGMDLRLIFCPYDLHYYRSTDILQSNSIAWCLAFVFVLGILYILKRWPLARPTIILGLGWFLAALLPVLNITPLINEYSFILTAEHFLYLPIVGILIILTVAADRFIKQYRKPIAATVMVACLLLTWHQNTFWANEVVLFERMLKYEPDFGRGHLLLAKAYYFDGHPELAEAHYQRSYAIISGYENKTANITAKKYYSGFIKEILFDWAQNEGAMDYWDRSLDKYRQAAVIDGKDASLYNNMAFVYLHMGDKRDAYLSLEQALRIDPSYTQARNNLIHLGSP